MSASIERLALIAKTKHILGDNFPLFNSQKGFYIINDALKKHYLKEAGVLELRSRPEWLSLGYSVKTGVKPVRVWGESLFDQSSLLAQTKLIPIVYYYTYFQFAPMHILYNENQVAIYSKDDFRG